jgi:crossover junction endodeoxyribonuclease RuvC
MRHKSKQRILAIDPGTREMGVAVLENGNLLYHSVETCPKRAAPEERLRQGRAAVARFIRDFRPKVLAVEKSFVGRNRNAAILNVLAGEIASLGRRNGIAVMSLAPNTVKKAIVGYGWATKAQVARAVAARFPRLKAYLPPMRKWKQQRQLNMFDAVAIGLTASRTMNVKGRTP